MLNRMYLQGKCDGLARFSEIVQGEIDVEWKSASKRKPMAELEVLVIVPRFYYWTAFYEDGTVKYEDSVMEWVDDFGEEYIPEGWYIRIPDGESDSINLKIPEPSVWMELPSPNRVGDM